MGLEAIGHVITTGAADQLTGADQDDRIGVTPALSDRVTTALKGLLDVEIVGDLERRRDRTDGAVV